MKRCTACGEAKPLDHFGKHAAGLHGKRAVCKPCNRRAAKAYVEANRDKVRVSCRNSRLKKQYGVSSEEYARMLGAQGGVCAICFRPSMRNLHVDHDHQTGAVRGLLCFDCNTSLGKFGDNPATLRAALAYLARFGVQNVG